MKPLSVRFKLVIILVWALPQMSTDIYLPSMPAMANYFHTSISMVQYTIFFYTVGFSLGALFFGPISDRVGRKPVILWSLLIAAIGSLIALIATSLNILFIARFIQGVALVGVGSTMRAVTKDVCPDKQEMARFGAVLGIVIPIAASIAPVIGGYIEHYFNWRVSFGFLLVYILVFLVYTIKSLPETNNDKLERPLKYMFIDYKEVLTNGVFFRYNAITAFALCSIFAYVTISPYILQVKVGLSPEEFGYTNLTIAATLVISSYVNSKMIYHRGIDQMLQLGVRLLGIAGILFLIGGVFNFVNLYSIMIPLIILVCGCGFIYPNASAGGLSLFNKNAGTAGAVYACIQMLGGAAGSGMISLMTRYGQPQECLGILIILQGIIGVIFTRQLLRKNQTFTE
jgi:Bcr/CflA subfamily drug resistance transporter